MFIGAALAGVAGALTAPLVRTFPYMGHSVIVTAFIVIIVGGIGSLKGAVVAAMLYAFVHTFVTTYVDGVIADIVWPALDAAGPGGQADRPFWGARTCLTAQALRPWLLWLVPALRAPDRACLLA